MLCVQNGILHTMESQGTIRADLLAEEGKIIRIEGQVRGIRGMLEKDAYCTDCLLYTSACGAAVQGTGSGEDRSFSGSERNLREAEYRRVASGSASGE